MLLDKRIQCAVTIFVILFSGGSTVSASAEHITLPNQADIAERNERVERIATVVKQLYGHTSTHTAADIPYLQRLFDGHVFKKDETFKWQTAGLAFGEVLAHELGLHWIMYEDQYGRDPALRYRETSIIVFPLTMLSKRIEQGRPADLQAILDESAKTISDLKNKGY
jgi:Domain of unknown function (DUF3806)